MLDFAYIDHAKSNRTLIKRPGIMRITLLACITVVFTILEPHASQAQVTLRDSSISWLTYDHSIGANMTLATYSLDPSRLIERRFNTLIIENEYLKVTLLPEYGGRIISMIYKPTGHEQLYQNPVGAPYGWWWTGTFYYNWLMIYGGIFPTLPEPEHGKSWFMPWETEIMDASTDTVRIKMSWTDDVTFSEYSRYGPTEIEADFIVTLAAGKTSLDVEVVLHNNADTDQRYEYWTNASMAPGSEGTLYQAKATEGAEILIPVEKLKIPSWATGITPIERRVIGERDTYVFDNLRMYKNWEGSGSAFSRPALEENYWGVINHDNEEGLIRVADNNETPYVKIWTFGFPLSTTIDPFNPPLASDTASDLYFSRPFIELWAGVSSEFNVPAILPASSEKRWTETYIPTVGLADVTHASEEVVANFGFRENDAALLTLNFIATTPMEELRIVVTGQGEVHTSLFDSVMTADPVLGNQVQLDLSTNRNVYSGDPVAFSVQALDGTVYLDGTADRPTLTSLPEADRLASFTLQQNFPNPFHSTTTIDFELAQPAMVRLSIYDVLGRTVAELVNEQKNAGTHRVQFDASKLSSGMYFYQLEAGTQTESRNMAFIQ